MVTLTDKAGAGETYPIEVKFYNDLKVLTTPKTISWSLYNNGSIVNSRLNVSVTPANTITIGLYGADLVASIYPYYLKIRWTYDAVYGNNMLKIEEVVFQCE